MGPKTTIGRRKPRATSHRPRTGLAERASGPSFRLFLDKLPGLAFTTTAAGEVEYVNEALLKYFDRPFEQLKTWRVNDSVHSDDVERVAATFERGVASGEAFEMEHRLRRADGVYRWFHLRITPGHTSQGITMRWYGLASDVHELKLAEEASRLDAHSLRLLVDNIPGLIYTMTPSCELEVVNARVLEYFGRTFEELRDWDRSGAVHPEDLPKVRESLRRTVEFGEPHEVEQRLRRADGAYRWFKPHSLPLRDAAGRILRWYCTLSDVEHLKGTEEALRNTQARLARAAHFAAMSELSASIAHEVKQPLAAVVANGYACRRWLSSDPPNIERALLSTDRIIRDGNAAADVIQRIRLLFRHAPLAKDELDINDVVTEVCSLLADDLRAKGVALEVNLQGDLPRTLADRVQMQQVIANFVRNGIDAMDGMTGRLKLLLISSRNEGGEVIVHVADRGVGIADSQTLFEPFYTTKAHGMGMGLAICRSIIEAHDGRLWVTRNERDGATFSFALQAVIAEVP